jgi:tRNA(Ile2) C34 agmatinyltransferase TiaS
MRKIKPVCRYCGIRVKHFGDVCQGCGGVPDSFTDEVLRMDREQYLQQHADD